MKHIFVILLVFIISACRTPDQEGVGPALLTNPGPESRQELEQTISTALDGARITLAEDVFTENSVLVIERGMQRSINRTPELGRDLGQPHRFQLFITGSQCILVDEQSGEHWPLSIVECVEQAQD
jgi:hypothetical protein